MSLFELPIGPTATITSVTISTSSTSVLLANPARVGVLLCAFNVISTLYITFGSLASASVYSYSVPASTTSTIYLNGYTGPISAIVAADNAIIKITEIT